MSHSAHLPLTNRFGHTFRALSSPNFRLFIMGQGISLIGTWMQQVAMSWLIYRMTHSAMLLGLVGFSSQLPALVMTPLAGVLVDKANRYKIILLTQTLAMIQAFILAALTLKGIIQVWHIIALGMFMGMVNAVDMPNRQAFTVDMVNNPEDLGNAIALNSSLVNLARLIGPSIAGLLIAVTNEGICFLLNAVSYIAVIIALLAMKITFTPKPQSKGKLWAHLKEGIQYAFGFAPIRAIILLLALVCLVGTPYAVLMPVYAQQILHGGANTLGFLMGASGVGALCGALFLASRREILGLGRWLGQASIIFALGLIALSFCRTLWTALLFLAFAGFGMMVQMAASNTLLQTLVDEDKRGRVMSLYTLAFLGMTPFGSLLAGILGDRFGVTTTVLVSGVVCLLGAIGFLLNLPKLREKAKPIYIQKGLLPELALGVQAASYQQVITKE